MDKYVKHCKSRRGGCRRNTRVTRPDYRDFIGFYAEELSDFVPRQTPSKAKNCRKTRSRHSCGHVCAAKKKTSAKRRIPAAMAAVQSDSDEGDDENSTAALVKSRVNKFFKDSNLDSDDDDVVPVVDQDVDCLKPSTIVKKYNFSDSDDDDRIGRFTSNACGPSTSGLAIPVSPVMRDEKLHGLASSNSASSACDSAASKKVEEKSDDIMAYVDAIIIENDLDNSANKAGDPLSDPHSFEQFRQETENMLKNVSELIDTFKGVKPKEAAVEKPPEPTKPKEDSPKEGLGTCPVCLDPLIRNICSTTCGHIFCKPCITKVTKSSKKCPTCRKAINAKSIHPLYIGV